MPGQSQDVLFDNGKQLKMTARILFDLISKANARGHSYEGSSPGVGKQESPGLATTPVRIGVLSRF